MIIQDKYWEESRKRPQLGWSFLKWPSYSKYKTLTSRRTTKADNNPDNIRRLVGRWRSKDERSIEWVHFCAKFWLTSQCGDSARQMFVIIRQRHKEDSQISWAVFARGTVKMSRSVVRWVPLGSKSFFSW